MPIKVENALKSFANGNLTENALNLFQTLGYESDRQLPFDSKSFANFAEYITEESKFNEKNALVSEWKYVDLLFQLTESELKNQNLLFKNEQLLDQQIISYLFFVIELKESNYNRTNLNQITREVNKVFEIPVMILFKYGEFLTLSVINRRPNQVNRDKSVLEKVTLIKDINFEDTHRAHIEILEDLSLPEIKISFTISNFVDLHNAWQKVLSTKELNKKFYDELFKWYLWAVKNVKFPQIRPEDDKINDYSHQNESVIRLLTRLLFCWFMKEKRELISKDLFEEAHTKKVLKEFSAQSNQTNYYRAILQNLFFATLSVPIEKRKYIPESFQGKNKDFGKSDVFRYQNEFVNPKENLQLFKSIPFLNGGLFECLDEKPEGEEMEIRLDGFSSNEKKQAVVPNFLFWGKHKGIDLSQELDNPKKKKEEVQGIFDILNSFKFTIEENTPLDEEIALDPDLLGRTFENLLASYNPETKVSARKQTGSFYTPREIVNYMVDESLIAYLKQKIFEEGIEIEVDSKLRNLVSFNNAENTFTGRESSVIFRALENLKVFDPACGSGAFPMGILQKLVLVLRKIDPENKKWFESLISRLPEYIRAEMRTKLEGEDWDYLRKLGIIQQSIYGVDKQPVAIQIAKLRFFISLLVDQKIKDKSENNFGLLPLPNLDFKLVCANSLVGVPEENADRGFQFEDPFFDKFTEATEKYFSTYDPREKKKLTSSIRSLVNKKAEEKINEIDFLSSHSDERFKQARAEKNKDLITQKKKTAKLWESYNNLFKHEAVGFFDTRYFFPEVDKNFNIVIGNPPYGAKFTQDEKDYFKKNYKHQDYQPESFLFFTEKSFEWIEDGSIVSFIIPNTWLTNLKLVKIRKFLAGDNSILNISHFHKTVFDAVVDTEVVIFEKGYIENNEVKIYRHIDPQHVEEIIQNQNSWKEKNGGVINIFTNESIEKIIDKIKFQSEELSYYCDSFSGVKPYEIGKGNPPQTKEIVKERIYDSTKALDESYKRVLRGSDINKYQNNWSGNRWIKYGSNLAAPRKPEIFSKPKIVIRQTGDSLIATYDDKGFICLNNTHVINQKSDLNLKYILALLNSSLLTFYFQYLNPETGEALAEVKKENVEKLLIKKPRDEKPFVTIVDYILFLEEEDVDSSFFQRLVNAMVYELYLPEIIRIAGCEVIKHLVNLPTLAKDSRETEKIALIENVYVKLSDQNHPVFDAMFRMDSVEEIRIIEGTK